MPHRELHRTSHISWLRAAVLGANDGLISTSSLILGVAAAQPNKGPVLIAGVAGLVAGALSMAAGEYVSVSSQGDTEKADLERERRELAADPASEHAELAGIYRARGLSPELADQVARELARHDALGAHARDELGMTEISQARPLQAALASAAAFAAGASTPVLLVVLLPLSIVVPSLVALTLGLLLILGGLAARLGGAPVVRGVLRMGFWGAVAMGITTLVGRLFGAVG